MLDAFRSMTSDKTKQVQRQTDELQLLITSAREERGALGAMLTTLTARSTGLTPLGRTLDHVMEKAAAAASKLDELAKRISTLDDRAKELEQIDQRIQALKDVAKQAELATEKATAPDGELQKHREAIAQLHELSQSTEERLAGLNALAEHVSRWTS